MGCRVRLFGVDIDALAMGEAVARILSWVGDPESRCRYVVTPNVDHTVLLANRADLREAYREASLVLADGWPVVAAARLLGRGLPERVAGSDLAPALFAAVSEEPMRVFLLGAAPGVAEQAAVNIHSRWPIVRVTGTYSPPLGFENDVEENRRILERIAAARPHLLIIGLGAPKQELWVHRNREKVEARVALCAGATIDFLAGRRRRAPRWMQRSGLEWLHRVACEPHRLAGRYARDAWVFPQLVWREWRTQA